MKKNKSLFLPRINMIIEECGAVWIRIPNQRIMSTQFVISKLITSAETVIHLCPLLSTSVRVNLFYSFNSCRNNKITNITVLGPFLDNCLTTIFCFDLDIIESNSIISTALLARMF